MAESGGRGLDGAYQQYLAANRPPVAEGNYFEHFCGKTYTIAGGCGGLAGGGGGCIMDIQVHGIIQLT